MENTVTTATAPAKSVTSVEGRDLVLTRHINAPRERVYRAWTDPEMIVKLAASRETSNLSPCVPRTSNHYHPGTCVLFAAAAALTRRKPRLHTERDRK